jgi:hypothetical protein
MALVTKATLAERSNTATACVMIFLTSFIRIERFERHLEIQASKYS